MANNRKIFTIEINGIQEAIKGVDGLTERINNLNKIIANLNKEHITIPLKLEGNVDADVDKIKKTKNDISRALKDIGGEGDDKASAAAIKARQKALEEVNKSYISLKGTISEYKKETKALVAEQTMANNQAKGYANTLNGLKAELKDLNAIKGDIDLDSEKYANVSKRILDITNRLKEYEAAQGITSRNVGNYAEGVAKGIKKASESTDELEDSLAKVNNKISNINSNKLDENTFKNANISVNDLKNAITALESKLSKLSLGTQEWKDTNNELKKLKKSLSDVEREMEAAVRAEDQLNTKLKLNINGIDLVFDDVNQAIGILEDKLYALAAAGKQNTEEFKNISNAAAELKIQVRAIDTNIDNMVEGSAGLNKMMSYFQGFSALATAGTGLSQLFGGDDEDAQRQMQTMTALIGVMESLKLVSEEMQKQTAFGKFIKKFSDGIDSLINKLVVLKTNFSGLGAALGKSGLDAQILKTEKAVIYFNNINKELIKLGINGKTPTEVIKNLNTEVERLESLQKNLRASGKTLSKVDSERYMQLKTYSLALKTMTNIEAKNVKSIYTFSDAFKALSVSIKVSTSALLNNIKSCVSWIQQYNIFNKTARATAKTLWADKAAADGATVGFKSMAVALKAVGAAAKLVRATLKAFLIFEVINIILKLIDGLKDLAIAAKDAALGNDKLVDSLDLVTSRLDIASNALERYKSHLDRLQEVGINNELETLAKKFEAVRNATIKSTEELQKFIKLRGEYKKLEENLSDDGLTRVSDIENLQEFRKEYENLMTAVEAGVDITDVEGGGLGNWLEGIWKTASDARSDLAVMQKRLIEDIEARFAELDLSDANENLEMELKNLVGIMDDEMYASALANIENLYPEEEWAKILSERLKQVKEMYNEMNKASKDSTDAQLKEIQRLTEEGIVREHNIAKTIRDNETQAIEDDYERQMKQLRDQRRDELDAAEGVASVIKSINDKYNRLEKDAIDAHNKELEDKRKEAAEKAKKDEEDLSEALRKLRDLRVENEKNSLAKRIQELENQRKDALDDAVKDGKLVNELSLEINIKYDKLIQDEKKKYYTNLLDIYEEYTRKQIELEHSMAESKLKDKSEKIDIQYNIDTNTSEGSFDFDAMFNQRIEAEKKYNEGRLQLALRFKEDKRKIEEEEAELDYQDELEKEGQRFEDSLKQLLQYKEDGLATEEEYNNLVRTENELHSSHMIDIETRKDNELYNINKKYLNDVKEEISKSIVETVGLYSEFSSEVSNIMSQVGSDVNMFGILDYGKTKKHLDDAKMIIKDGIDAIDKEMDSLDEKLKNKEITFVDYKKAKSDLKKTKDELQGEGNEIKKVSKDLVKEVASQYIDLASEYVNQISSILSTFNEAQSQLIDNEIAEVEHQLEIQQEAYDKAEEAANAHKNKMDGIEDELKDARGARREFLIDTLAAQQSAYLEEVKAQQEAEQEKEKLEKKQQALEKKRKEQDKKAKIQQSIINTFTAVTNALAVSPWFVGLALSAVALAMGMKNVAAIKATPIYKDGGVIEGKRHKDGGVKVMGGQAEVEGGEFITNRKSTEANLPLLNYINDTKRAVTADEVVSLLKNDNTRKVKVMNINKYQEGGQIPNINTVVNKVTKVVSDEDNKQYVVAVTDIINAQDNLNKVKVLSGMNNNQ